MNTDAENTINAEYWESAAQRYRLLRSPLIPTAPDLEFVLQLAHQFERPLNILQLGVTPALVNCAWPEHSTLISMDHSQQMISHIWPGSGTKSNVSREALLKDWLAISKDDGSFELIVGDGSFNNISTFRDLPKVVSNLHNTAAPDGLLVQRIFVTPDQVQSPEHLIEELKQDHFDNFHSFKWRLVMSLQKKPGEGVTLNDVWEFWNRAIPDPEQLVHSTRWTPDVYQTIEMYRDQVTRFFFPSLDQVSEIIGKSFTFREKFIPDYDLGECCPTLVFSSKS